MPLGCLLGTGAHRLAAAILGAGAAATAWHIGRAAAHMMQYLPSLLGAEHAPHSHTKAEEEEAMLGGCVWIGFSLSLFYVVQNPTSKQKLG